MSTKLLQDQLLPYLRGAHKTHGISEIFWQEYVNALTHIKIYQNKLDPYYYPLLPIRALFYGLANTIINGL